MEKPISLILEEAKNEYVNAINEITRKYNLPMYLVDMIFTILYREINDIKNKELKQDINYYEESLKENKEDIIEEGGK